MKQTKRVVSIVAVLAILVLSFCSCSSQNAAPLGVRQLHGEVYEIGKSARYDERISQLSVTVSDDVAEVFRYCEHGYERGGGALLSEGV